MLLWDLLGKFPGTDYESFNYEWIIGKLKELKDSVAAALASEEAAAESAEEAHTQMLVATVQATHARTSANNAANSAEEAANSAESIAGVVNQVNTNTSSISQLVAHAGDESGNSELLNIRIGYDGETYQTAGDAVRDQISDLHTEMDRRIIKEQTANLFNKEVLYTGRLGSLTYDQPMAWNDFRYSQKMPLEVTDTVVYFSQLPYEVVFYNGNTVAGIYPASQMIDDGDGWYKTPVFTTVHDGVAFDFPVSEQAAYHIDAATMITSLEKLDAYIAYGNFVMLYGERAALHSEIPAAIDSLPEMRKSTTNTFVGDNSGINTEESTTDDNGKYNTALGVSAMRANTTGDHCTAVGFQAMQKNVSGNGNTGLGEDALYENVSGSSNVAAGSHALQNSTTSGNTAVGSSALINQSTGYYNTAVGVEAGRNFGTAENAITTDDRMTMIGGYTAKKTPNQLTNSTVIGFEAKADKSNQIVLGNTDVTELVIGNKKLIFNNDGTVEWTSRD